MKRGKVAAIGCGAVLLLLALVIGLLGYGMFGNHPRYSKDVAGHEFAPASATSIEVFEAQNISGVVSVSYGVEEAEFRKFAAGKGWELSSRSGLVQVRTPGCYLGGVPLPLRELESYLFYEKRHGNGGGITVIYIPAESRAYIDKSNR